MASQVSGTEYREPLPGTGEEEDVERFRAAGIELRFISARSHGHILAFFR